MDPEPLIEGRDLTVVFGGRGGFSLERSAGVRAVDGVSLAISAGQTMGLVGESGSGKSTLGRALLMLRRPTTGSVLYRGQDLSTSSEEELRTLRRKLQIVFQDPYSSLNPRLSVGRAIGDPIRVHRLLPQNEVPDRVAELLEVVGLRPEHARRFPYQFSGGERQRIGIARALSVEPEFIVCDEPVSALDVSIQAQVLNLLVELRQRLNLTYLFIAHDLSVVRHISQRVAVMYLGRIVEIGASESVYRRAVHPYTRALLSAAPVPDPAAQRQQKPIVLSGDLPSPAAPPSGCRFHTRCWLYERLGRPDRCRMEDPPLVRYETATHQVACHFPTPQDPRPRATRPPGA